MLFISRHSRRHVLAACALVTTAPIHWPNDALPVRITAATAQANVRWRRWSSVGFAWRTHRSTVQCSLRLAVMGSSWGVWCGNFSPQDTPMVVGLVFLARDVVSGSQPCMDKILRMATQIGHRQVFGIRVPLQGGASP